MLKLDNISFAYIKNTPVINDISFDVKDGECVVLLGPNGAGKSTILNCILGVNKIQNGNIYFDEKEQKELTFKEKSQQIAYVPQLIEGSNLTVSETILLGRLPHFGLYPSSKDHDIVKSTLQEFGLEDIKDKQTNEISGGERQKVSIARALIQESKIILFDEPTSNLDIKAQLSIIGIIKNITSKQNRSSLLSMHDINLAMMVGDKFVFLKEDRVYQICTKKEITEELLKEVYETNIKLIEHQGRKIVIYEKEV